MRKKQKPFVLYGWHLSYFTGKVRCYLRHKNIPFVEKPVDLYTFRYRFRRRTGVSMIPVVVTPEGEWLQDTSVILDRLEARFPARPVVPVPELPVMRFASYAMELWGDELWIPAAMHTRWSYRENYPLFEREAGRHLLPYFPRALQDRAARFAADLMRSYLPTVGVVPSQHDVLDRWIVTMLDALDRHFAETPYLYGDAPSLGDFGLVGPMYGHLGRDPWPKEHLVAARPHLRAWIDRMAEPPPARAGARLAGAGAGDHLPATLEPIHREMFRQLVPTLEATALALGAFREAHPHKPRAPRALGAIEVPLGDGRYRRAAIPYMLWMAQRALDVYRAMGPGDREAVRAWLQPLGGEALLELEIPRLRRVGGAVAYEASGP